MLFLTIISRWIFISQACSSLLKMAHLDSPYLKYVWCQCLTSSTYLSFLFSLQSNYLITMFYHFFIHRVLKCGTLKSSVETILFMVKAVYSKPTGPQKHSCGVKKEEKNTARHFIQLSAKIYLTKIHSQWNRISPLWKILSHLTP